MELDSFHFFSIQISAKNQHFERANKGQINNVK